jgi:DNA (cytosine-5)-methyltransferase 1
MNSLNFIDLFSGCGGLALGFHQAGFETYLANELHPDPAATYVFNLLNEEPTRMLVGSIDQVLSNHKISLLKLKPFEIDCIAGGPPCQGFSNAGSGNPNDTRNQLYLEFLRVVKQISPKSVVFENVPGFAGRYGLNLHTHLIKSLEEMGYIVDSGVIQAKNFGIPQLRKRFIAIAVHKEILGDQKIELPKGTWNSTDIAKKLICEKIIGDLDSYELNGGYGSGEIYGPSKYYFPAKSEFQKQMRSNTSHDISKHTWNTKIPKHTDRVISRMKEKLSGTTDSELVEKGLGSKKNSQRVLKKHLFPNITIVSLPDDYIHYNVNFPRTLSVRECARFQTFPDDFRFMGKRTTGGKRRRTDVPQYTQVANAIPPRLAKELGVYLNDILTTSYSLNHKNVEI